jgi:glycosyltransferase involved in cell wall biosynthesis
MTTIYFHAPNDNYYQLLQHNYHPMANSPVEVITAVQKLKNDPELYQATIANGWKRAQNLTTGNTLQNWIKFFQEYAFPEYEK